MKNILTIIKKEFARFFKDTRLMLTTLILPGLMIFALYSLMGEIMGNVMDDAQSEPAKIAVLNMPDSQSANFTAVFDIAEEMPQGEAIGKVKDGELDLFIGFPKDFDKLVGEYAVTSGAAAPNVEIFYNSSRAKSSTAYSVADTLLSAYEESLANKFDINRALEGGMPFDVADTVSTSRMILSMVVPMVLLMLLFSGCMAVAPESIAGEKERGTIATMLVTPVKRSHIAIGKIAALSVIALLSGLSSAIGLILSLPRLAKVDGATITFSMFGFGDLMTILAVIMSTVLIIVTLISIVSAYAKSVKEASGLVIPLMILVLLCGVFSMFATNLNSIGLFFIPLFNSALVISAVLSGAATAASVAVTVCMNLVVSALLVFLLTLMFKSEKVMFNK